MPQFTFTYKDIRHGWATALVSADGGEPYVMGPSYLSDALRDLASAVNALLRMDYPGDVRCSWEAEPGEYRWILRCVESRGNVDSAIVSIRILEFDHLWAPEEDTAGREAFVTNCSAMRLATQLKRQMKQILNDYGLDGYKGHWVEHAFPSAEFEKICDWIDDAKRKE